MTKQKRARFKGESRFDWTVQAEGSRYAILTKQAPFKPKGEVLYTICDKERGLRGPSNLIGNGWDMTARGPHIGSRLLHLALLRGDVEVSHRNNVSYQPETMEVRP